MTGEIVKMTQHNLLQTLITKIFWQKKIRMLGKWLHHHMESIMPICKIYHTKALNFNLDEIEKIIVTGFEVKGTRPEILVLPVTEISYGRDIDLMIKL